MWAFFFNLLTQHQPLFYSKLFLPDKQYGAICCLTVQHTATHRRLFCRSYIDKIEKLKRQLFTKAILEIITRNWER